MGGRIIAALVEPVVSPGSGYRREAWSGRRVLVTGATGMIGSWLVRELLENGAHVVALVMDADPQSELYRSGTVNRTTVVNGTLENYTALERAISVHETDTVFHLGAQTLVGVAHRSPLATFESNVRGSYNLLEACRVHASLVARVVVASSDKAYGASNDLPYREDAPLDGRHPYEVSKSCTDLIARSYHHSYGLPVAVARCGNVFGGGDLNFSRIVPGTIRSILHGQRPVVRSDGTFTRDYIYVRDVAAAYLTLAESLDRADVCGQGFNFSAEAPLSVLDMVARVARKMDSDLEPVVENSATGEIRDQYLSARRARSLLGWAPTYTLGDALDETIQWYREFFSSRDRTRWS